MTTQSSCAGAIAPHIPPPRSYSLHPLRLIGFPMEAPELVTAALDIQIANYLLSLLPPGRPQRLARMSYVGETKHQKNKHTGKWETIERGKYEDITGPLTSSMLAEHAQGATTYSYMLDREGKARAGAFDIDTGGRAGLMAGLAAARALGVTAFAIVLPGEQHDGGHVWAVYDKLYDAGAIRAQMQCIVERAGLETKEIWPGYQQGIRGLFGKHQTKGTRGQLLTQDGEVIDLDTDLATGFALVCSLPTNTAPPTVETVKPERPTLVFDQPTPARARRPGEHIDTAPIFAEARSKFNAEHTWPELLSTYGGSEKHNGWACNCGWQHTHDTQIAITSRDKIVSFSPNCRWAPHKDSGRASDKFAFYCEAEHGGNYRAASETIARQYGLWVEPRQQPATAPDHITEYVLAPALVEARRKDAQRKREQRTAAADELRETILGRAAIDEDMPWQAREVIAVHLKLAGWRGWHRASIARMAEMLGRGDRWVQRFNEYLLDNYVSRTLTSRHDTAIWTLLEKPIERIDTPQTIELGVIGLEAESKDDHPNTIKEYSEIESLELVRGGASSLDDWAWCEAEHSADELAGLFDEPAAQVDTARAELLIYIHALACEAGQVASYDGYSFAQLEVEAIRLAAVLDSPRSPVITPFNDADEPESASYDPSLSILVGRPYSGTPSRQYLPDAERRRLASETMRPLADVDAGDTPEQLPLEQPAQPRKLGKERKPSALDRYQIEVALMSESELAGELRKHQNTIKARPGEHWLAKVRDKLELVQAELDSRGSIRTPVPRKAHQKPLQPDWAIQLAMAA